MSADFRPEISVVVPSYNKPNYLAECLGSIQSQTFSNWECIVVSDGSPRVEEIRAAVAAMRDPRFRLVEHKENRGLAAARNTGIREARADFVLFVDEDDWIRAECLARLLSEIRKTGADIVCPQGRFFGASDRRRRCHSPSVEEILVYQPLLVPGSLIRKKVFAVVGMYDEHPIIKLGREDHEWWIRTVRSGTSIHVCDAELYFIRRSETNVAVHESLDFSANEHSRSIYRYILDKHRDLYDQHPQKKKQILCGAWIGEANYYKQIGKQSSVVARLWCAFMISKSAKHLRRALKETLIWLVGPNVAVQLRAWRRQLSAAGKAHR